MALRNQVTGSALGGKVLLATFDSYQEAQRAVDKLSDERFPVEHTAIVAEGLRFVEQVTGRLDWGRAILNGAVSGGLIGAFIGFLFGLLNFFAPLTSALSLALYGLLLGAVAGAVVGVVGYAMTGGRRDFTSVGGMQAERYDVMVSSEHENEARRILGLYSPS
jgi:uncharacterized membrane protein